MRRGPASAPLHGVGVLGLAAAGGMPPMLPSVVGRPRRAGRALGFYEGRKGRWPTARDSCLVPNRPGWSETLPRVGLEPTTRGVRVTHHRGGRQQLTTSRATVYQFPAKRPPTGALQKALHLTPIWPWSSRSGTACPKPSSRRSWAWCGGRPSDEYGGDPQEVPRPVPPGNEGP